MPVVAVKSSLNFYYVLCHACTLLLSFNKKKGPGGYLIRVDLIRFPGSIPGAMKMKMCAS